MEDSFYLVPQCPSAMSTKNVNLLLRACDLYGQFPPGPLFGLMCYGHHLEVLINFFNKEPIFLQCPQNVCSQTYPSLIKAHVPLEKVRWTSLCLLPCFSPVALEVGSTQVEGVLLPDLVSRGPISPHSKILSQPTPTSNADP